MHKHHTHTNNIIMSTWAPDDTVHVALEEFLRIEVCHGNHLGEVNECHHIIIVHLSPTHASAQLSLPNMVGNGTSSDSDGHQD